MKAARPLSQMDPAELSRAEIVQSTKAALLALLTDAEKTTQKITKSSGRVYTSTFEDAARLIVSRQEPDRWQAVSAALTAFQTAVNDLWTYLYRQGTAEYLASYWRQKHRTRAKLVPKEDMEAEVVFMIRELITHRFDPKHGVPFRFFAARALMSPLSAWVTKETTVISLSRDASRAEVMGDLTLDSEPTSGTSLSKHNVAAPRSDHPDWRLSGAGEDSDA